MNKWITAGTAAALTGAAALARSEYERTHLDVVRYDITTDKLGSAWNGFKAVFLSDLHDNSFGSENEELLAAIENEQPDIVLIGGDMLVVKEWAKPDFAPFARLYHQLVAKYPVYYAFGNHEQRMKEEQQTYLGWWEAYREVLKSSGMKILVNKSAVITKEGTSMRISGITIPRECYRKGRIPAPSAGYLNHKIGKASSTDFELLLAHTPTFAKTYADWGADLVVSGHFHGGTIRIPGLGGVMTPQLQFFSPLARGSVTEGNTRIIVSGGLGTHSINVRLNNLPQVVVLTWHKKNLQTD
jgi:uncharacterized protein